MCLCDGKGKKPGEKRVKRDKKVESTKFWEWSVPSGTALRLRVKLGWFLQVTQPCVRFFLYIPHQGHGVCLWHCSAEHQQPIAGPDSTEGINMSSLLVLHSQQMLGLGKSGFSFSTFVVQRLTHSCVCISAHIPCFFCF